MEMHVPSSSPRQLRIPSHLNPLYRSRCVGASRRRRQQAHLSSRRCGGPNSNQCHHSLRLCHSKTPPPQLPSISVWSAHQACRSSTAHCLKPILLRRIAVRRLRAVFKTCGGQLPLRRFRKALAAPTCSVLLQRTCSFLMTGSSAPHCRRKRQDGLQDGARPKMVLPSSSNLLVLPVPGARTPHQRLLRTPDLTLGIWHLRLLRGGLRLWQVAGTPRPHAAAAQTSLLGAVPATDTPRPRLRRHPLLNRVRRVCLSRPWVPVHVQC